MKNLVELIFASLLIISLTGCTMENVESTITEQTEGLTNTVSDQFDDWGNELDESISEKVDEVIDDATVVAEAAVEDAKEKALEKAQEKTEEELSDITDNIVEGIGDQIDKLVDFRPGLYFEEPSEVTYDQDGIRMNAYWEYAENESDFATYESGAISIAENADSTAIPSESIVTISFFDNLPDQVTIFKMVDGVGEEVTVSVMNNPLTKKNTYSFEVIFGEDSEVKYVIYAKFDGMDDFEKTISLIKK